MGCVPSFPVSAQPINFGEVEAYFSTGKRRKEFVAHHDVTDFEKLTSKFFSRIIEERRVAQIARLKYHDLVGLASRFPQWTEGDIAHFRTKFKTFDENQDGLIDFPELDNALTQLGDTSPYHIRRMKFDEIDEDHSESVDFEEFLHLIEHVMSSGGSSSDTIGNIMCSRDSENINIIRQFTAEQQMQVGLF